MDDIEEIDCSELSPNELEALANCILLLPSELTPAQQAVLASIEASEPQPTQH